MKKVIIFIPAYNEESTIGDTISLIFKNYPDRKKDNYKINILIVDDGSADKTYEISSKYEVEIIKHPCNLGLGAATRTAMEYARDNSYDIAVKFDADLQNRPEDIHKVIEPVIDGKGDIVFGSRFTGKITYRMPLVRYLGNKFFTWLMRFHTGWQISDAQTSIMAFSKNYLDVFNISADYNPPQQILLDGYSKKMRYFEVPVNFDIRKTGTSFVNFKYPFIVIPVIARMLIKINPVKLFSLFGLCFASIIFILFLIYLVFFRL